MISGIKVLFVLRKWDTLHESLVVEKMSDLLPAIARFKPDVIVTTGFFPGELKTSGLEIRKRWMDVGDENALPSDVAQAIENVYRNNVWTKPEETDTQPLVSIYTPTYNTGSFILDTYMSIREQTYPNWEWVVVDDGSNDGTYERLLEFAKLDSRVRPIRADHTGKVGTLKDMATRLSRGVYLVELDHDDMLTRDALMEVVRVFKNDPTAGMVYTNCACFFQDGSPHTYEEWIRDGRYRETEYNGKKYMEAINPNIYDRFGPNYQQQFGWFLTVGPNHIRAYRTKTFWELGGYNPNLVVADDWDLYARFFLRSKCVHIDKMLYLYRFLDAFQNTTFTKNKAIQDHLEMGRDHYRQEFIDFNAKRLEGPGPCPVGLPGVKGPVGSSVANVSFVVLDWNTPELTSRCLESVKATYPTSKVVLVNNGSEKPLSGPADHVVNLEINLGYAAGCNRGAMEVTTPYVCFLNSDTIVEAGLLEKLLEGIGPGVGVVGPYSDYACPPQGYVQKGDAASRPTIQVPFVVGVCLLTTTPLFRLVGGFDPRFCNWEDNDYCTKIRKAGFGCKVVGGAWIHHEGHASFKANSLDVDAKIQENKSIYDKKHPKIKVIALTKNERQSLPGFVEQFGKITRDIAIVDSESTDGTVQWALDNGIEAVSKSFTNFADQRNYAVSKFEGGADWIVMFDPDERLDKHTLENFFELMDQDKYDVFLSPLLDSEGRKHIAKPFLFRNTPDMRWVFPVHEKLIGSSRVALVKNAVLTHHLELHTKARRNEATELYASLGGRDDTNPEWFADILKDFPILNYEHQTDDRIADVFLGPKISVVIATHGRVKNNLLGKAVQSALNQDYLSKEILIIGDNCQELQDYACTEAKVVNLPMNHGAGGAIPRNYGIMLSSSGLIAYLDDDNEWEPNHLSSLYCHLGDAEYSVSSMSVDGNIRLCDVVEKFKVDTSAVLHKKSLVERFGWWKNRDEVGYAHDWEFVSRWVAAGIRGNVTKMPTLRYNAESSGQKDFLVNTGKE